MQQALRTLDIQYQDLPQIYRCVQHLSAIETTLQQCELWHMTKLDRTGRAVSQYRIASGTAGASGSGNHYHSPELPRREMNQPKSQRKVHSRFCNQIRSAKR